MTAGLGICRREVRQKSTSKAHNNVFLPLKYSVLVQV